MDRQLAQAMRQECELKLIRCMQPIQGTHTLPQACPFGQWPLVHIPFTASRHSYEVRLNPEPIDVFHVVASMLPE